MKTSNEKSDILDKAINLLSDPQSYQRVYHKCPTGEQMISLSAITQIMEILKEILFPGYFGHNSLKPDTIRFQMGVDVNNLFNMLSSQIRSGNCFICEQNPESNCSKCGEDTDEIAMAFIDKLAYIREMLAKDALSMHKYDPASKSLGEVIFAYPAVKALTNYRVAHELFMLNVPIIPRIITEMAHSETGIDIHPGATIGEYFTIDHGTGVVIGETSVIGNNVRLYQGVTLGAKSFPTDANGNPMHIPRHPILEDDVVIYAGATILGRVTIGKGSVIGGNVWVTHNLPPNSRVVQRSPREMMFSEGGGI